VNDLNDLKTLQPQGASPEMANMSMIHKSIARAAGIFLLLPALCCLLLLANSGPIAAQTPEPADLTRQIKSWKNWLDKVEEETGQSQLDDDRLSKLSIELEKLGIDIENFIAANKPLADDARALLDKLGKPPQKGEPPEAEEVARQRKELRERFTSLDGAIRSAMSLGERTTQLRELVHNQRRALFARQLLKKGPSPFSLALWREGVPELSRAGRQIAAIGASWARSNSTTKLGWLLAAAAFLWLMLHLLIRPLISRYRHWPATSAPPPFFRKAMSAGLVSAMRAAPPLAAALAIWGGMKQMDMLSYPVSQLAPVALAAFAAIALISAISTTLLAPRRPIWRLFPVSSSVARRLNLLTLAMAAVYGVDLFINSLNETLLMPLPLTILQSAISAVMFAGLMVALLRTPFRAHRLASSKRYGLASLVKLPLWAIVFSVLGAAAFGYVSLARFLSQQTVVTGSVLIIAYLAWLAIDEFTVSFGEDNSPPGSFLARNFELSRQRREQIGAFSMLAMNAVLALVTLPIIALQWGFGWNDVTSWMRQLLFGFEFGGIRISLAVIFVALCLFLAGIMATRLFQRWLDRRVLSRSHSQTGAEDSIKTAIGYLGIVLSALLAISYTGIDFSNLAIIAGALSVGIGFGLQSIVNNFVSGLILLAERPIKVGDWIIVGGNEGIVRRISVRATEIETFDRAHIIIPNSELITGTVRNWTLRGRLGRAEIVIGVAYDSDPDEVQAILLRLANAHEEVVEYPAPYVIFKDFGASSLDFVLRIYLRDINRSLRVRSQLRFAILRELRAAGVEIPFPQRDINLRDMDRLEKALAESKGNRSGKTRPLRRRRKKRDDASSRKE
jgi:small-conductance mechanosensitive channel